MPEFARIRVQEVKSLIRNFAFRYLEHRIPVLVAGDFNDTPMSAAINLMEKNFIDLHVLKTEVMRKSGLALSDDCKKSLYPDFTLACNPLKKEAKKAIDYFCLDYIFVLSNRYMKDSQL